MKITDHVKLSDGIIYCDGCPCGYIYGQKTVYIDKFMYFVKLHSKFECFETLADAVVWMRKNA